MVKSLLCINSKAILYTVILFNCCPFSVNSCGNNWDVKVCVYIEIEKINLLWETFTGVKSVTASPNVHSLVQLVDSSWIKSFWACTKEGNDGYFMNEAVSTSHRRSGQVWIWSSWGTGRLEFARARYNAIYNRARYSLPFVSEWTVRCRMPI